MIPFFAYPPEIRKVIYTTNAIESLNYSLRKVTKNRLAFPTAEAAMKLVFMALALTGVATMWMAVFADMGTSLLVTLNGMRPLAYRRD